MNFIKTIKRILAYRRRDRDAQNQRFNILEHYLRCCRHLDDIDEFDQMCMKILKERDCYAFRHKMLIIRRGAKEKALCYDHVHLQNLRIKEGETILKLHGLCK